MSYSKFKQSYRAIADRWGTSSTTVRRYADRGCNWDNDFETALFLLKYTRRRTPAMRKAIYAVPGIDDPHAPKEADYFDPPATTSKRSGEIDCHAIGAHMMLFCDIEAGLAKLKHGDTREALRLAREVAAFDAMTARLTAENSHLWSI
jgi:hypothetical protein